MNINEKLNNNDGQKYNKKREKKKKFLDSNNGLPYSDEIEESNTKRSKLDDSI